MMVTADMRRLDFIDDMDICIIFGNALDNAIEACKKIENKSERYIHIKNVVLPEYMLLNISNSFSGEFKTENALFVTTKKDSENHGFGLKNIRSSVEKYGGTMTAKADPEKQVFHLSLLIPFR